jgi:hypothetical protein
MIKPRTLVVAKRDRASLAIPQEEFFLVAMEDMLRDSVHPQNPLYARFAKSVSVRLTSLKRSSPCACAKKAWPD